MGPAFSAAATWIRRFLAAPEWREWRNVCGVLFVALLVRVVGLHRESLWYDELTTFQYVRMPTLESFLWFSERLNPVPPYNPYLIMQYWLGPNVLLQRWVAVLFGMASLASLYGFTRYLFNARVALIATAWMSFVPWHVYYSQEIRNYGIVVFLTLLSMWAFARMASRPSVPFTAINLACNLLLMHIHMIAALLSAAQGLFLLIYRPRQRWLIVTWTALQIPSLLSFYYYFHSQSDRIQELMGWLAPPQLFGGEPSIQEYVTTLSGYNQSTGTVTPIPSNRIGHAMAPFVTWFQVVLLVVCGAGFGFAIFHLGRAKGAEPQADSRRQPLTGKEIAGLMVCWAMVPPALLVLASYLLRPMFVTRYLFYAMVPAYIGIAYAVSCMPKVARSGALAIPVAFFFAFHFPGPYRTPFREVVTTLRANADKHTSPVIYLRANTEKITIDYHWRGADPVTKNEAYTRRVLEGGQPVLASIVWFLCLPEEVDYYREKLKKRGHISRVWTFLGSRPITLLRWVPNPDQIQEMRTTKWTPPNRNDERSATTTPAVRDGSSASGLTGLSEDGR